MLATLRKLAAHIEKHENNPHIFTKGRTAKHEVTDAVNEGFAQICESTDLCTIQDEQVGVREIVTTGGDVGVL
jgi:hypothetical protein